jgi:hypothetical protein
VTVPTCFYTPVATERSLETQTRLRKLSTASEMTQAIPPPCPTMDTGMVLAGTAEQPWLSHLLLDLPPSV